MEDPHSYFPRKNRPREVNGIEDSDEEEISDSEDALITDPEKAKPTSPRADRLGHAFVKAVPYLRSGVQCLIPSFFLPTSRESKRLHPTAWLDGLRGIASMCVAIHHASLLAFTWTIHDGWAPTRHQTAWFVRLPIIRLIISGPPQVAIFFVVSGYAISHKALKLSHQGRFAEAGSSLFSSVFRRHPRLFLPAAAVVLCTAMMAYLNPNFYGTNGFPDVALPTRTVPPAATFLEQLRNFYDAEINSTRPINNGFYEQADPHVQPNLFEPNLWTLPMEFSSSMVVFLFLMTGARLHNRVRITLALLFIVYLQYYFDFPALHMFLSGMLICDLHFEIAKISSATGRNSDTFALSVRARGWGKVLSRTIGRLRHSYVVGRVIGLAAFIFAAWLLSTPELSYGPHESWGYVILSSWVSPWYGDHFLSPLGAILVVLVLDHTPFLQVLFTNSFSQYMGKISFSLYLIHGPLLWSLGLGLAHFTIDNITGGDTNGRYFAGMMIAFTLWWPIAIYLSDLTARHIDDNCVWLAKWVYDKLCKEEPEH